MVVEGGNLYKYQEFSKKEYLTKFTDCQYGLWSGRRSMNEKSPLKLQFIVFVLGLVGIII